VQKTKKDLIREAAESDLETFIRLVHPLRVLGSVHLEILRWWTRQDAKSHQLVLMPRDHQKSALVAYRVAWAITRNPAIRILYISATANLATKQLGFIKDILTSDVYRRYWPEMVNAEEAKRTKWTESEISVDHPKRREENVRDPTVFTAGLTTTVTGLHADVQVLDDVVVKENAYTEEGRNKVAEQYSLLASIAGAEGEQWVVGTRYHPSDLYDTMAQMRVEIYSDDGEYQADKSYDLYEIFKREVEDRGDMTGQYLWPKQQRADGKWFGFDQGILAKKYAQYTDKVQFFAQYYNNPNNPDGAAIKRECFQYYEKSYLSRANGFWYYKGQRLNVFAAVDFAYSLRSKSDYTAIVVVGVDPQMNYYVLDIDRFKADNTLDYFKHVLQLHQKWDFRKMRAEATAAQQVIINDLKQTYIRQHGLALSIEDHKPNRAEGAKEERIAAVLDSKYQNRQMWHYMGGHCQTLEDELVLAHPPHDDVKDALAQAVLACVAPTGSRVRSMNSGYVAQSHPRFGGVL
jgi:Uncharacterized protein conserved in bacteria